MSRCPPFVVVLSDVDRAVLEGSVAGYTAPFWLVQRGPIVLLPGEGLANVAVVWRLGVDVDTVSKWRERFVTEGLAGLIDRVLAVPALAGGRAAGRAADRFDATRGRRIGS